MPEQIIGLAYNRTVDAIQRHSEVLHVVHYDKLAKYPEETLKIIYKFLEEKLFEHDFDNVPITNIEDDDVNGYIGLHETRAKLQCQPSDARSILGNAIVEKYYQ